MSSTVCVLILHPQSMYACTNACPGSFKTISTDMYTHKCVQFICLIKLFELFVLVKQSSSLNRITCPGRRPVRFYSISLNNIKCYKNHTNLPLKSIYNKSTSCHTLKECESMINFETIMIRTQTCTII